METPIPVRLKAARKAAGYTQQQLGMVLGMDPNTASARMNQYERGKHTPDYQTMQRIGKVLGVPTAYFYCEDDLISELLCVSKYFTEEKIRFLCKEVIVKIRESK